MITAGSGGALGAARGETQEEGECEVKKALTHRSEEQKAVDDKRIEDMPTNGRSNQFDSENFIVAASTSLGPVNIQEDLLKERNEQSTLKLDSSVEDKLADIKLRKSEQAADSAKSAPDAAKEAAWENFRKAGIQPRKRSKVVEDILDNPPGSEHGPPEDVASVDYWKWRAVWIAEGYYGKWFFICVVIFNGVMIGVQVTPGQLNDLLIRLFSQVDHGHHEGAKVVFDALETIILIVFIFELVLKLFGLGCMFWEDYWNWFDFVVVLASLVELFVGMISSAETPGLSSLRLLRIFRVIRLLGMFERLATLVQAFFDAMVQVLWVGILIFIMIYIFAVLGQGFFCCSGNLDEAGVEPFLFDTIPASMLTLVQILTMDDWATIFRPIGNVMPASWLYSLTFVVLGICMMNLVTPCMLSHCAALPLF